MLETPRPRVCVYTLSKAAPWAVEMVSYSRNLDDSRGAIHRGTVSF